MRYTQLNLLESNLQGQKTQVVKGTIKEGATKCRYVTVYPICIQNINKAVEEEKGGNLLHA